MLIKFHAVDGDVSEMTAPSNGLMVEMLALSIV